MSISLLFFTQLNSSVFSGPLSLETSIYNAFGYFEIVLRSLTQQLRLKLATMRRAAALGQTITPLFYFFCYVVSNDEDNRKRGFTITILGACFRIATMIIHFYNQLLNFFFFNIHVFQPT